MTTKCVFCLLATQISKPFYGDVCETNLENKLTLRVVERQTKHNESHAFCPRCRVLFDKLIAKQLKETIMKKILSRSKLKQVKTF